MGKGTVSQDDPRLRALDPVILTMRDAPLAKSSRRHYIALLLLLLKVTGRRNMIEVATHAEDTCNAIHKHYSDTNTRKTMIVSLKAAMKYDTALREAVPEAAKKVLSDYFKTLKTISVNRSMSGEKTEREAKAWVDWPKIVEGREKHPRPFSKEHLLLCCYTMIPPLRSDFGNVRIFKNDSEVPKDYPDNHLIMSSRTFVLQKYKTSRSMGVYRRQWPLPLMRVIRESLRRTPRTHLFLSGAGRPYGDDFREFVERVCTATYGKPVTINILRHSYISNLDFNSLRPRELAEIASDMRHSVSQQLEYRKF